MTFTDQTTETCFQRYSSTAKLQELARQPYDLTKEGNLTPERISNYQIESCGFKMLYGTEKVDESILEALGELADEAKAVEKMAAMQDGEVVNVIEGHPSPNLPALHTAVRDFFEEPRGGKKAVDATQLAKVEVDKLEAFLENNKQFTDLIMVGIGGSDLGPRAAYIALKAGNIEKRRVHFISNVDPDDAALVLEGIDLNTALVAVISKSGTTLETATNEEIVRKRFRHSGLKPEGHFVAVTGKGSPMDDRNKYLEVFNIWDYIGGRYSMTSMAGGVPLAFALGIEGYREYLRGANAMDKSALEKDYKKNLPLMAALLSIWNQNFLGHHTVAVIPYSQALNRFSAHVQQVVMESNGKSIDKKGRSLNFLTGPIIWGEPGTNAQHSFCQLIHQGSHVVPVEFLGFAESQYGVDALVEGTTSQEKLLSNLFAQSLALAKGKKDDNPAKSFSGDRPNHILLAKKVSPYTVGALAAYYEHWVAFQGFIWDINSYDQEGVQLGKVLADGLIDSFASKRKGKQSPEDANPLGDELLKQLGEIS